METHGTGQAPALRVQSLGKALSILLTVSGSRSGLKAVQIINQTGLPKQATHHLLHSLVALGLLRRTDQGGYVLGLTMGQLAAAFERQFEPPERLVRIVREVAEETGETSYASGWWNGEIVTMTSARGTRVLQPSDIRPGTYADAHARASGKLLLALADDAAREHYLGTHSFARRTPRTLTSPEALREALDEIRDQNLAVDYEEYAPDLCCLAVPVTLDRDLFALAVSWPTSRYETDWRRYLAVLKRSAA